MSQGTELTVLMKGIVIMMKQDITQVQYATDIQDGAIEPRAVTMRCMCKNYEACFLFLLEPHQLLSNLLCFGNFLISVPISTLRRNDYRSRHLRKDLASSQLRETPDNAITISREWLYKLQ